jgi:formate/nitrite transporter FocA (FNT family)
MLMILIMMCVQSHVVAAFEQSLANMTSRLQNLTSTAENKVGAITKHLILKIIP